MFTFPRSEEIAIYVSVIPDVFKNALGGFCVSVKDVGKRGPMRHQAYDAINFVDVFSDIVKHILKECPDARTQIYTYSPTERTVIVNHLIGEALKRSSQEPLSKRVLLCLGALCEGATLLQTSFQPLLLSGTLLSFLSKRNLLSKQALQTCCQRLGLNDEGSTEDLRKRVEAEQKRLAELGGRGTMERREVGQLEKVVVLKREVERLISLPVPGFVDLPQTLHTLTGNKKIQCLADDVLFGAWCGSIPDLKWEHALRDRNRAMHAVVENVRKRLNDANLKEKILLNDAKALEVRVMDVCNSKQLKKLLFMLQVRAPSLSTPVGVKESVSSRPY